MGNTTAFFDETEKYDEPFLIIHVNDIAFNRGIIDEAVAFVNDLDNSCKKLPYPDHSLPFHILLEAIVSVILKGEKNMKVCFYEMDKFVNSEQLSNGLNMWLNKLKELGLEYKNIKFMPDKQIQWSTCNLARIEVEIDWSHIQNDSNLSENMFLGKLILEQMSK